MKNILINSIFFVMLISCNSQKKIVTSEQPPKNRVEDILGAKFDCVKNTSASYKLCFAYEKVNNVKYVAFAVFDINSDSVVYNQRLVRGVKWKSDFVIKVDNYVRTPLADGSNEYYLYDVKTLRKIN